MFQRLNREHAVSDLIQLSEGMWVKKTAFITVTTSFLKYHAFLLNLKTSFLYLNSRELFGAEHF